MALMDKFKKPMPKASKFADEGPPSSEDEPRGSGGGEDEMEPPELPDTGGDEGSSGGYGDHEDMAADDLADIVGVSPEDVMDFKNALQTYVSACIAKHMSSSDGAEPGSDNYDQ